MAVKRLQLPGAVVNLIIAAWPGWAISEEAGQKLSHLAGRYHGDAAALRICRLELTEEGAYRHACFEGPRMMQAKGRVRTMEESVVLINYAEPVSTFDPSVHPSAFPVAIFRAVRWGQRLYLLGHDQQLDFCIAIARKQEPRTERRGVFFLREGDEDRPATTGPPPECQSPPTPGP